MFSQSFLKRHVDINIIEQLRHDEICPSPRLLDEKRQVILKILILRMRLVRVSFWVCRNNDTKIISVILTNIFHKVDRIFEFLSAAGSLRFALVQVLIRSWRISTQRQNIPNPDGL